MKNLQFPNIAILIVNFKTKKYIIDLLKSYILYEKYSGNVVFYIGDNASGENLEDLKKIFKNLNIKTYQIPDNRGFGAGNNYLSQYTTEEIIFLINPDIIWREPIIEKLIETFEKTNSQVIGPRLITKKGNTQVWDHGELFDLRAKILQYIGSSYWKEQKEIIQVSWVSGAAFMIKSEIFRNVGGFDEDYFLYREEEDLCIRIRKEGGKIYYAPAISLIHLGSVVSDPAIHMIPSHNLYLQKHYPLMYKLKISSWILKLYFRFF